MEVSPKSNSVGFEKMIEELKSTSQRAVAVAAGIAIVSIYLLQRASDILVFGLDPLSPRPQAEHLGLKFSYLTMSIAWPVVLAVLCAAFQVLVTQRARLLSSLRSMEATTEGDADSLDLLASVRGSARLIVRGIGLLPIIGLVAVALTQGAIWILYRSDEFAYGPAPPAIWLAANLGLQAIAVGLSIGPAINFGRTWKGVLGQQPSRGA